MIFVTAVNLCAFFRVGGGRRQTRLQRLEKIAYFIPYFLARCKLQSRFLYKKNQYYTIQNRIAAWSHECDPLIFLGLERQNKTTKNDDHSIDQCVVEEWSLYQFRVRRTIKGVRHGRSMIPAGLLRAHTTRSRLITYKLTALLVAIP